MLIGTICRCRSSKFTHTFCIPLSYDLSYLPRSTFVATSTSISVSVASNWFLLSEGGVELRVKVVCFDLVLFFSLVPQT